MQHRQWRHLLHSGNSQEKAVNVPELLYQAAQRSKMSPPCLHPQCYIQHFSLKGPFPPITTPKSISATEAPKKPREDIWWMNLGAEMQEAVLQVKTKLFTLGEKPHGDTSVHFSASHRAALASRAKICCSKGNKELLHQLP